MSASLVIRRPGLTVDVSAPRVVALPLHWLSRGHGRRCLGLPFHITWAKERLVLAMQIFVSVEAPKFGCEVFKLGPALWDDHADRLVDLQTHRHQFAGELPVHAENRACPVSFDYALQRTYGVFRIVRRPANQQVVARRGAKQYRQMPGQDAVTEMADRHELSGVAFIGYDADVHAVLADPRGRERASIAQLPAALVGDEHRQAPIGPSP